MDHEHEHEVVLDELGQRVVQSDGEVRDQEEQEWNKAHDRNLSDQLGRCVHPDVIHAGVSLSDVDGLLSLEYNNSGLEIEEHLHNCHEIYGTRHVFN